MKRVKGIDPKVSMDETGGIVFVSWYCPYCGEYIGGSYYSSKTEILQDGFEVEGECEFCGKTVVIECEDAERDS